MCGKAAETHAWLHWQTALDARMSSASMGNLNTHCIINRVDDHDEPIGTMDRADLPVDRSNFRVVHMFLMDDGGRLLLQQIAPGARSSGKWGSSAAGYVLAGEGYRKACKRTVAGELGIDVAPKLLGKTTMADLGATKFITVYQGHSNGPFNLDATQVAKVRYFSVSEIKAALNKSPEDFTETFHAVFSLLLEARNH